MNEGSRFLRALLRQPVDRTPVWIMRQAGRYLPEYRQIRAKAGDFLTLCKTPELACQVTLQPVERYPLDAAIIFSDILTIPDALGLGLSFVEKLGPVFENPLRTPEAIQKLPNIEIEQELSYVMDAIRMVQHDLAGRVPLIGFSGSPWTMACYMVEGSSSKEYSHIRRFLYQEPKSLQALLSRLSEMVVQYLSAQIKAGADAVMIFDTWGGLLGPQHFIDFSLNAMKSITQRLRKLHPQTPVILFSKNSAQHIVSLADSGCQALGLDWTVRLREAKRLVGDKVALQGNLDPCVLYASPEKIVQEVKNVLEDFGEGFGHVFNLGHGILPDIDPEHVSAMIEAVQTFSIKEKVKS